MTEIPKFPKNTIFHLAGILIIIVILIIGFFLFLHPGEIIRSSADTSSAQQITSINQTDHMMPLFHVAQNPGDTVRLDNWKATSKLADAPSPEECPAYAEKALESFGGLPQDARLDSIHDDMRTCMHDSSGEKCFVTTRNLVYRQKPYNVSIYGTGGKMTIALAAGGVPSSITKRWFTLEEVGIVHTVPASEAVTRLRLGEGKNIPSDPLDLTILSAEPGYYTPENITNTSYLEPVWVITARDEIQKKMHTLYIPAGKVPAQEEFYSSGLAPSLNFSMSGRTIPRPDVLPSSHIMVGTSGPVGEDAARESIRKFTANPGIMLNYHGQSSKQHEGCGGQNYNWVFYEFSSGSCRFYVDTYTGFVIYASMDPGCTGTGIPDLPLMAAKSKENASEKVSEFLKGKYPQYDKRRMVLQYHYTPDSYHKDIEYHFTGLDTNMEAVFDPVDGHLKQYAVYNSNRVGKCASELGILVIAIAVIIFLFRRR